MRDSYRGARLLLVHAHPDDETINNGATMALYAARGAEVTLVTCTRGEEGEILLDHISHFSAAREDRLGEHRVGELAEAMKALGVTDFRFLGAPHKKYRDSGMMGTEPNKRPDTFWNASIEESSYFLAKIIDEVKPHIMITYDEFGGYGHPDHIQAHRTAMRAAEKSTWNIQKIYWNIMPKSIVAQGVEKMKELGSDFFGAENVDDLPFVKDDSFVSAVIHGDNYVEAKMAAMKAHATQISLDGPFFALSNNIGVSVFADEYYTLVKGEKGQPQDERGYELDLFAGVKL